MTKRMSPGGPSRPLCGCLVVSRTVGCVYCRSPNLRNSFDVEVAHRATRQQDRP